MWNLHQSPLCDYAVRSKGCGETIPTPVGTMPDTWIVATCPLCGDRRRYLPTDVFRGMLSYKLYSGESRKPVQREGTPWAKRNERMLTRRIDD
jgi:hypothetical protein